MNTFWVQVDVKLDDLHSRFYMNDCGGQDPVVTAIDRNGWRGYEPPLPEVIAKLCRGWKPVFVDVGANTGYYSLLAAVSGASKVYAFEPMPSNCKTFSGNVGESALGHKISISEMGVGESQGTVTLTFAEAGHGFVEASACPNQDRTSQQAAACKVDVTTLDDFANREVAVLEGQQVLMKIASPTHKPEVLKGGLQFISRHRPVIAIEILPESDLGFFETFCAQNGYDHIWLRPGAAFEITSAGFNASLQHRDHLLIPREKTGSL